jgi:hypothetical protein
MASEDRTRMSPTILVWSGLFWSALHCIADRGTVLVRGS